MSIRQGLLALLEREPMYGYQLRSEFEAATGSAWPLNVGQVYTTLSRLERDGLVEPAGNADDEGRLVYRITPAGRAEVGAWFDGPVDREARPRDELAIKLALSLSTPGVDARAVIDAQRTATIRALQELTRQKVRADPEKGAAWLLVLEAAIFATEAEVRWLDHCEASIAAARTSRPATASTPTEEKAPR
jgi:DNA-binding PadR family transcriptional regulator